MNAKISTALATTAIIMTPACAQEKVDISDKAAVEKIVKNYILENPEIIEEALIKLTEQQQLAETEAAAEIIRANFAALYEDENDFFIGPADAPITIVEFFDYRCGYCKRTAEWVSELPEKYDNQVRVVFKELPILSTESEQAALAAMAAKRQGKYLELHLALMELDNSTGFDPDTINAAAAGVGVDVELMRSDMKSISVQTAVANSKSLARTLGITGTPNFIVGDQQVPGANMPMVEQMISDELAKLS